MPRLCARLRSHNRRDILTAVVFIKKKLRRLFHKCLNSRTFPNFRGNLFPIKMTLQTLAYLQYFIVVISNIFSSVLLALILQIYSCHSSQYYLSLKRKLEYSMTYMYIFVHVHVHFFQLFADFLLHDLGRK
jgi:hypothetical protein